MMRTPLWLWVVVLLFPATLEAQNRETLIAWIVDETAWEAASEPVEYGEDDIETLAGDNARAVRKYGLIGASLVTFDGRDGRVETTLYEMIESTAAFGLFTLERERGRDGFELSPVGAEGYRLGDELVFWQSKYVARLAGSSLAVEGLAKILSANIVGRSAKPPVSRHLPPEGLVAGSEQYILDPLMFEDSVGLESAHFGFDDSVEVAVARYRTEATQARLVMLLYPTQQLAKQHSENWLAATGSITPHKRSGPLVAIIQETTDPDVWGSILSTVNYESQVTWNEPLPGALTLPYMILTIFTWIGIALAFTVVAGVGFGGLRIYMKTRYPNRGFGGGHDEGFIQLNIDQSVTPRQLNQ